MKSEWQKLVLLEPIKLRERWLKAKKNIRIELRNGKLIAGNLRRNSEKALIDLQSGKVFHDDEAAENLKNTLIDTMKAAGMTGIFLLPGGYIGLVAIRRLLNTKEAKKLGIENLLTLTIEEARKIEEEKNHNNSEKKNYGEK